MDNPKVLIEKLVFGGQALGRVDGRVAFAWNALPGETVELSITKKKKDFLEGIAESVSNPSPHRIAAREDHYLSCSPWQIMDWETEEHWKTAIAQETYERLGGISLPDLSIVGYELSQYSYRNKMEYALAEKQDGTATLASFERSTHRIRAITPCLLPYEAINEAAEKVLRWMDAEKLPARIFKSIIIRANRSGEAIAVLFSLDPIKPKKAPPLDKNLIGIQMYLSNPKSPASTADELLFTAGKNELTENISNKTFHYGALSFFQVNLPLYEQVLSDIQKYIPNDRPILDFYGGTGSIGLSIDSTLPLTIVDSNEESIEYAKKNIIALGRKDAQAICSPAEKVVEHINNASTLVLDPPRAGMHPKVVKKILAELPPTIIYLSCNISTQARDLAELKNHYEISFAKLYNFFPRTPHIEGLIVLKKK